MTDTGFYRRAYSAGINVLVSKKSALARLHAIGIS